MSGQVMPLSEARLPVNDWGLIHSDITYDVVPVWDGAFFRLADYLDRFESSMRALRMDVGMNGSQIRQALTDMVAASGLKEAYVAMVASRGVPLIPGTRDPRDCGNPSASGASYVMRPELPPEARTAWIAKSVTRIPRSVSIHG